MAWVAGLGHAGAAVLAEAPSAEIGTRGIGSQEFIPKLVARVLCILVAHVPAIVSTNVVVPLIILAIEYHHVEIAFAPPGILMEAEVAHVDRTLRAPTPAGRT